MTINEAAQILKDHCLQSDCRECQFAHFVNSCTSLEFHICNIGSPSFWNLDGNFDGLKEANKKFCEIAKGIAEDDDLQHVGYTDEQLGREK